MRHEVAESQLWALLPKTESFSSDIYVITLPLERVQLPTRLFLDALNGMQKPNRVARRAAKARTVMGEGPCS